MPVRLLTSCQDQGLAVALCANLVQAAGDRIVAEATDGSGLVSRAASLQPDVVLLEHTLVQEKTPWQLLARLRHVSGGTRFLLLCDASTQVKVIDWVRRGVEGYLLKSSEPALHARAVLAVHRGETWFGRTALLQALRSQIGDDRSRTSAAAEEQQMLTQREGEILDLIGNGLTNKEIARKLKISDNTVKTHLHRVDVKLPQSGRYKAFVSNVELGSNKYPAGYSGSQ